MARDRQISKAILERLEADANQVAGVLNPGNVIRQSRLLMYGGATLASLLILAGVLKWGPREISDGVAQLVMPKSARRFHQCDEHQGRSRAPPAFPRAPIRMCWPLWLISMRKLFPSIGGRWDRRDDWQGQAMEPAKAKTDYRYSIFNIQDSIEYFVESNGVRSEVFKLNVVDLPYVKQLDLTLNFPGFSHLPAKTIEDGGDIAALKGTVASITARLSGKVRAARIVFPDGKKIEMRAHGSGFCRRPDRHQAGPATTSNS